MTQLSQIDNKPTFELFAQYLICQLSTDISYRMMCGCLSQIPQEKESNYARVIRTEEKGSDVNIATHLLNDAYQNDYEVAVIISNDSDLVEPVKIVRGQLGLKIGILNPHRHPSRELRANSDFFKKIRRSVLAASQFPSTLTDSRGTITKPEAW